jgi:hypothetical protein
MIHAYASAAAPASQPPGLFLLAWGLFASVVGIGVATNFRGTAYNVARRVEESSNRVRRSAPWNWRQDRVVNVTLLRFAAAPFAVTGPIVTIAGVAAVVHGHVTIQSTGRPPAWFGCAAVGIALAATTRMWTAGGWYRTAARRGKRQSAMAGLATLGGLGFAAGLATGQMTIGIVAWVIACAAGALTLTRHQPPPGPHHDSSSHLRPHRHTVTTAGYRLDAAHPKTWLRSKTRLAGGGEMTTGALYSESSRRRPARSGTARIAPRLLRSPGQPAPSVTTAPPRRRPCRARNATQQAPLSPRRSTTAPTQASWASLRTGPVYTASFGSAGDLTGSCRPRGRRWCYRRNGPG